MARIARILTPLLLAILSATPAVQATDVSRDQDIAIHIQSSLFGPKKLVFPGGSQVPGKDDLLQGYDSQRLGKAFGEVWSMTNGYAPTNGHSVTNGHVVTNGHTPTNGMTGLFPAINRNIKVSYPGKKFWEYGFVDESDEYRVVGWSALNGTEIHLPNQGIYSNAELKHFIERTDVSWEEHKIDHTRLKFFMKKTF